MMPVGPILSLIASLLCFFLQNPVPVDAAAYTSSRVIIREEVLNAIHARVHYSWKQIEGPPVLFLNDDAPNVVFMTSAEEGVVRLSVTVTGARFENRVVTVGTSSFATSTKADSRLAEGHTSQIEVASTSLRAGHVWNRTDSTMEIAFRADNPAVFAAFQPRVFWKFGEQERQEITKLFNYSKPQQTIRLKPERAAELQHLVRAHPGLLYIEGRDSFFGDVMINQPVSNWSYRITGRGTPLPGSADTTLAGSLVTLEGLKGYTAFSRLDTSGRFTFDNIPADVYALDVQTGGGLLGMEFVDFEKVSEAEASVNIPLFDAEAWPSANARQVEASGASRGTVVRQLHVAVPGGTGEIDLGSKIDCSTGSGPARFHVYLDGQILFQRWSVDCDQDRRALRFFIRTSTFQRSADLRMIVSTAGPHILGDIRYPEVAK